MRKKAMQRYLDRHAGLSGSPESSLARKAASGMVEISVCRDLDPHT
jgi:hypothetical protein